MSFELNPNRIIRAVFFQMCNYILEVTYPESADRPQIRGSNSYEFKSAKLV